MPGIFGVVDLSSGSERFSSERLDIARRMADAMGYEPSYALDLVSCPGLSACAGRAGWSHADGTKPSNPQVKKTALLTAGEPVVDSDSTTLVAEGAYLGPGAASLRQHLQRHGLEGLKDVEGSFAGFLIDQHRGRCVLFNDRYGVERLFVHTGRDRLIFSSEAKAILAVVSSAREFDPAGLAEWLSCGCTLGARSLFRDVEVLPAGTAVEFSAGKAVRTRYFDRTAPEQLPQVSASQFVEAFTDGLETAVRSAVNRPPKAALSLTGGLDSRLIIGCLDAAPDTVPCYTFGSMYRPTMDVAVANSVATVCEQPHQSLQLGRGFLTNVDEYLRRAVIASDGYLGLAGSAELYLNQLASRVAPARVTGNWGGELMRGVRAFKFRVPKGDFIQSPIRHLMTEANQAFAQPATWHPLSYTLFHQMPYQGFGRYAVERSQVQMRSPFLANGVVNALYQAPAATRSGLDVVTAILKKRPGLIALPTDTGRLGHSSRAVARLRQTYRRVLVKAEYMTSHGAPDWMAALSARVPFLETAFLGRDKFQHFRYWTRHELSGVVRDILRGDDTDGLTAWFDMRRVSRMVDDHIAGRANYTDELDKVMTVQIVRRTIASGRAPNTAAAAPVVHELALDLATSR